MNFRRHASITSLISQFLPYPISPTRTCNYFLSPKVRPRSSKIPDCHHLPFHKKNKNNYYCYYFTFHNSKSLESYPRAGSLSTFNIQHDVGSRGGPNNTFGVTYSLIYDTLSNNIPLVVQIDISTRASRYIYMGIIRMDVLYGIIV
jgi:hypothetical protein